MKTTSNGLSTQTLRWPLRGPSWLASAMLVVFALLFATPGQAGEIPPIEAVWLNQDGDAHIEIAPCGDKLCGTIVWLEDPLDEAGRPELDDENPEAELRRRPILGLPILEDFPLQPSAKGLWSDGTIYDPNNGKTYSCQMSFKDRDTLKIRGYIGISLLGRTEIWTRVPTERATSARRAMEQELAAAGGGY